MTKFQGDIIMYTIGIDIGGTSLRIGLIDEKQEYQHLEKVPQGDILVGDSIANLTAFIRAYVEKTVGMDAIAGVCAALPATISRDRSTVLNAPNINGFDGVAVKDRLEKELGLPVFLEKDVNVQLYYDLNRFDLLDCDCVVACYVGTGLGNAMYIDGKLLAGHNGVAGELGHIPAWDLETNCSCGNPNCVEPLVAGKCLTALQKEKYPDTPVGELFQKHGAEPELIDYIRHLAYPIATAVNLLDPAVVILGGGVVGMAAFPRELLEAEIRRHARKPLPEANLRFVYSENTTGENGVIGSGLYAWDCVKGANAK